MINFSLFTMLVTLVVFIAVTATAAQSKMICGNRSEIVDKLSKDYKEEKQSAGIALNGNLVEVFSSKKGNWTIIITKPPRWVIVEHEEYSPEEPKQKAERMFIKGTTCLAAVGQYWQVIKEPFALSGRML